MPIYQSGYCIAATGIVHIRESSGPGTFYIFVSPHFYPPDNVCTKLMAQLCSESVHQAIRWPVLIRLLWDHAIVVLRPRSLGSILQLLTQSIAAWHVLSINLVSTSLHSDLAGWALPKVASEKRELPVLVDLFFLWGNGFVDTAAAGYQTFSTRCVNVKKLGSPEPPCLTSGKNPSPKGG